MSDTKSLQKNIMRRVYYAYGLRLATHPLTLHAGVLVVAAYILTLLVHVEMVLQNIAATEVADLGTKLWSIVAHADLLTLGVFGMAIFTALSLRIRLQAPRFENRQGQPVQAA